MGHNSVVSGHPKSTRIPWVDGLSVGSPDLGCHKKSLSMQHGLRVGTKILEFRQTP